MFPSKFKVRRRDLPWTDLDHRIEIMKFPGGEPHVKIDGVVPEEVIIEAHVSDGDLMTLLVLTDALRRSGASVIDLYIPYFPGARQDRSVPLTVKVYADIVNSQGYRSVTIVDPHSDVTPALIDRCVVIPQHEVFRELNDRGAIPSSARAVLVAPDQGAIKKTEEIAKWGGYDVFYGRKHRDMYSGELTGFSVDDLPEDMIPIVVDDICDGGGTFLGLRNAMGDVRDPMLVVTHGIFSKPTRHLAEAYGAGIVTTNTFAIAHYTTDVDVYDITEWALLGRHLHS